MVAGDLVSLYECPRCGGMLSVPSLYPGEWFVGCPECHCSVRFAEVLAYRDALAVTLSGASAVFTGAAATVGLALVSPLEWVARKAVRGLTRLVNGVSYRLESGLGRRGREGGPPDPGEQWLCPWCHSVVYAVGIDPLPEEGRDVRCANLYCQWYGPFDELEVAVDPSAETLEALAEGRCLPGSPWEVDHDPDFGWGWKDGRRG